MMCDKHNLMGGRQMANIVSEWVCMGDTLIKFLSVYHLESSIPIGNSLAQILGEFLHNLTVYMDHDQPSANDCVEM